MLHGSGGLVSGELHGVTRGPRLSAGHPRTPARPWDPATVHTSLQIEIIAGVLPLQYIKYTSKRKHNRPDIGA
jgi:hypothetical protein